MGSGRGSLNGRPQGTSPPLPWGELEASSPYPTRQQPSSAACLLEWRAEVAAHDAQPRSQLLHLLAQHVQPLLLLRRLRLQP